MCAISSIPTTRLSNQYMALRVMSQIQADQKGLFQIQSEIASGRRITTPSDDAPAASRAMTLQSLLERKTSVQTGLKGIQDRLSATEAAVGNASSILNDLRATALSVIGSGASQAERDAAVGQFNQAIDQMLKIANQTYQGSYLFSGSRTQTAPLAKLDNGIAYNGNDIALPGYSDIDQLFSAGVTGDSAFGVYSSAVRGSADLNPVVGWNTKLSDLNGGQGVRIGSVAISDGTQTSIVSIAGASTIGDVARLLEAHPPGAHTLTARVTSRGLEVSLNSGTLSITEVGNGSTAAELGIKSINGIGPGPIVGDDLNPQLTLLTKLDDVLGSRSRAYLPNAGLKNDLIIDAVQNGAATNGATVKYVDDGWYQATAGITSGNEFATYHTTATAATSILKFPGHPGLDNGLQLTATTPGAAMNNTTIAVNVRPVDGFGTQFTYNPGTKSYSVSAEAGTTVSQLAIDISGSGGPFTAAVTSLGNGAYVLASSDSNATAGNTYLTGDDANTLAVHIEPNTSTANAAIAAINAEGTFHASLDPSEEGNTGNGALMDSLGDPASTAVTSGGSGQNFDRASGLQIVNGGHTYDIDLHQAVTIEDLLNSINGSGANVLATLNAQGTGIDVRSRLSGADFAIGENGGTTAAQLGIRSSTTTTALTSLNHGLGVRVSTAGDDFQITRRDGTTFGVSLGQGVVSSARLTGVTNASLLVSRVTPGTTGNAFSVEVVDSGSGGPNTVALVGNKLQFSVDVSAGFTAQQAVSMLAADATLAPQFTAQLDRSIDTTNTGGGNLAATASPVQFTGGKNAAVTMGDVLDLINNDPTNLASGPPVVARLATVGNGIELVNDGPGGTGTLSVTKLNASVAAVDLGLISDSSNTSALPTTGAVASATFTSTGANNDFVISAVNPGTLMNGITVQFQDDGVPGNNSYNYDANTRTLTFDVDPATTTANDIIALLSGDPQFKAAVTPKEGATTNDGTGFLGTLPASGTLAGGTADVLTSRDTNPQEVQGMFTALYRLRDAIQSGDQTAIQLGVEQLDTSTQNLTFMRADLGTRMKGLDVVQTRIDDETVGIQKSLSDTIDVDFASAVSEMALKQSSFQASLQIAAQIAKTTLLDYL